MERGEGGKYKEILNKSRIKKKTNIFEETRVVNFLSLYRLPIVVGSVGPSQLATQHKRNSPRVAWRKREHENRKCCSKTLRHCEGDDRTRKELWECTSDFSYWYPFTAARVKTYARISYIYLWVYIRHWSGNENETAKKDYL